MPFVNLRKTIKTAYLILLLICQLQAKTTIAVYDFINQTKYPGMGIAVSEGFAFQLASQPYLSLLERSQLSVINKEIEMGTQGFFDVATLVKKNKHRGAQYVILGSIKEELDLWGIDIYLFDVHKNRLTKIDTDISMSLDQMLDSAIPQISRKLNITIPRNTTPLYTRSKEAFKKYAQALYFEEKKKISEAIAAVERSLDNDPNFKLAQTLLKRLQSKLLKYLYDQRNAMNIWYRVPVIGPMTSFVTQQSGSGGGWKFQVSSQSLMMSGITVPLAISTAGSKIFWLFSPFAIFFTYNTIRAKRVELQIDDIRTRMNPGYPYKKGGLGLHFFSQPVPANINKLYKSFYKSLGAEQDVNYSSFYGGGLEIFIKQHIIKLDLTNHTLSTQVDDVIHTTDHWLFFPAYSFSLGVPKLDSFRFYAGAGVPVSFADNKKQTIIGFDTTNVKSKEYDFGYSFNAGIYYLWADDFSFDLGVRYFHIPLSKCFRNYRKEDSPEFIGGLVYRLKIGFFIGY